MIAAFSVTRGCSIYDPLAGFVYAPTYLNFKVDEFLASGKLFDI